MWLASRHKKKAPDRLVWEVVSLAPALLACRGGVFTQPFFCSVNRFNRRASCTARWPDSSKRRKEDLEELSPTLCRDTLLEYVQSATKLHLVAKLSLHLMVCPFFLYETHCCILLEGVGSARHKHSRCAMSASPCPLLRNVLVPAQSQSTTTKPASHARR